MKKTFQTSIFQRFLNDSQIEEMVETYNASRFHAGREGRVVCELDHEIYKKYKKGVYIQILAHEYNRSVWWIWRSIQLAIKDLKNKSR